MREQPAGFASPHRWQPAGGARPRPLHLPARNHGASLSAPGALAGADARRVGCPPAEAGEQALDAWGSRWRELFEASRRSRARVLSVLPLQRESCRVSLTTAAESAVHVCLFASLPRRPRRASPCLHACRSCSAGWQRRLQWRPAPLPRTSPHSPARAASMPRPSPSSASGWAPTAGQALALLCGNTLPEPSQPAKGGWPCMQWYMLRLAVPPYLPPSRHLCFARQGLDAYMEEVRRRSAARQEAAADGARAREVHTRPHPACLPTAARHFSSPAAWPGVPLSPRPGAALAALPGGQCSRCSSSCRLHPNLDIVCNMLTGAMPRAFFSSRTRSWPSAPFSPGCRLEQGRPGQAAPPASPPPAHQRQLGQATPVPPATALPSRVMCCHRCRRCWLAEGRPHRQLPRGRQSLAQSRRPLRGAWLARAASRQRSLLLRWQALSLRRCATRCRVLALPARQGAARKQCQRRLGSLAAAALMPTWHRRRGGWRGCR